MSLILTSLAIGIFAPSSMGEETSVGGSNNPEARRLFDEALKKTNGGDNAGALVDLTQAITIDRSYWKAYANRASARFNLKDYRGAIADLDVALKHFPNMPFLVNLRQRSLNMLNASSVAESAPGINRQQANNMLRNALLGGDLADSSTLLMMQAQRAGLANGGIRRPVVNPFAAHPLVASQPVDLTPGVTKQIQEHGGGDSTATDDESARLARLMANAPADKTEASSSDENATRPEASGETSAKQYYDSGCEKNAKNDFASAIPDFDRSIALNPKFGDAWANRGLAKFHIKDYKGALSDFEEADKLMPNNAQLQQLIQLSRQLANQ